MSNTRKVLELRGLFLTMKLEMEFLFASTRRIVTRIRYKK